MVKVDVTLPRCQPVAVWEMQVEQTLPSGFQRVGERSLFNVHVKGVSQHTKIVSSDLPNEGEGFGHCVQEVRLISVDRLDNKLDSSRLSMISIGANRFNRIPALHCTFPLRTFESAAHSTDDDERAPARSILHEVPHSLKKLSSH